LVWLPHAVELEVVSLLCSYCYNACQLPEPYFSILERLRRRDLSFHCTAFNLTNVQKQPKHRESRKTDAFLSALDARNSLL